jgi:O-antigen ligase
MHPNAMALSCVLTLPGLMLLFLEAKNIVPRVLAILSALVTWRAINYSGSRTALYTMMAMSLAMYFLMYRDVSPRMRFRLLAVGAAAIVAYLFMKYAAGPVTEYSAAWRLQNGSVVSDTIRANDQTLAIDGFLRSPIFGEGYQWLRIAHNMYLQVLHSAGLVGLIGYLLAYLFPLYMVLKVQPLTQDYPNRILKNCLLTAAFGVIVWGWAQTNINALNPTIPLGLLLYISVMRPDLLGRAATQQQPVMVREAAFGR